MEHQIRLRKSGAQIDMFHKTRRLLKISAGKTWKFFGGVKAPSLKHASDKPIEVLGIPSLITLPLERYLGKKGSVLVQPGDHVKRGQVLTDPRDNKLVPLHASTSGTILQISNQLLPHPSGFTGECITIKPDGLDECVPPLPLCNWETQPNEVILQKIRDMGVEGMGGALYPTAAKLASVSSENGCKILIINGCECEPGLSCDDRLMQENADEIALGIRIIKHILKPKLVVVAILENKSAAIKTMKAACEGEALIRVLKTRYPQGNARSLIKTVTGIEIPYSVHTSSCGVIVNNVATALAVKRAVVDGLSVTSRVLTVLGHSMKREANVEVRLGTSVRFVLSSFHLSPEYHQRVILGGAMMGYTLPSIDVPVTKSAACIYAPGNSELPEKQQSLNCIRCGRCARVCPSRLVPYQMYAFSKSGDHAKAKKCGIGDCVLCGCCSFECPSHIDLTLQFRREMSVQRILAETEKRNTRAREVAKEHEIRENERKKRLAEKKAAALARIQGGAKKAESSAPSATIAKESLRPKDRPHISIKHQAPSPVQDKLGNELSADRSEGMRSEPCAQEVNVPNENTSSLNVTEIADHIPLPLTLRRGYDGRRMRNLSTWDLPKFKTPQTSMIGIDHGQMDGDQIGAKEEIPSQGEPSSTKDGVDTFDRIPSNLKKLRRQH